MFVPTGSVRIQVSRPDTKGFLRGEFEPKPAQGTARDLARRSTEVGT